MKSHYEVTIYCTVIAGALGAGESLVSLLYWTPGSLLDIHYTKEASVPLNVYEALKVFGITASRTSQVRCQNSLRFWVWLLNMLESEYFD